MRKFSILFCIALASTGYADELVFKKKTAFINGQKITVEIADNDALRERGLMFRGSLPESSGMLFIFSAPIQAQFWMKDTLIPLSIGYFTKSKVLTQVIDMEPASAIDLFPPTYSSKNADVVYALEMNKGWFFRHHIKLGAQLKVAP